MARLDSLIERTNRTGFVYALDAINATATKRLVYDANAYANGYKSVVTQGTFNFLQQSTPQTILNTTDTEVVRVATFLRTRANVTAHDVAIPITFRHDFGRRLHAEISAAATATFVNAEISTDVQRRALTNRTTNVLLNQPATALSGSLSSDVTGSVPPGGTIDTSKFTNPTAQFVSPQADRKVDPGGGGGGGGGGGKTGNLGGGKSGSGVKPPELPGKNVGRERFTDTSDDVLFGFNGSVSLVYDLDEAGNFFAEVWGRYHWSEDLTLRNRLGSSEIDMSGFEGGIGVGVRF